MSSIKEKIKGNKKLKKLVHWMMIPPYQARPRRWVSWFVNPFYHKKGKGSVIRRSTRMDVLPFNRFELGDYSTIEDFCTINNGVGDVIIGNETRIGMGNVVIGPVTIGNSVIFAQNIVMSGLNHSYEDITVPIHKQKVTTAPIIVEDECWIGANAVLTAGVTIGKHSVIAAGAIVTKDIPPYSVAVGNPARVIKQFNFEQKKWVKL
ncbi:MAG TPA: acyltransferase [Flavisolibacter sp.]|nr:acyltransferase [Flavisolibacter sp.]